MGDVLRHQGTPETAKLNTAKLVIFAWLTWRGNGGNGNSTSLQLGVVNYVFCIFLKEIFICKKSSLDLPKTIIPIKAVFWVLKNSIGSLDHTRPLLYHKITTLLFLVKPAPLSIGIPQFFWLCGRGSYSSFEGPSVRRPFLCGLGGG